MQTISETVSAATALGRRARRLADQLGHHEHDADAPRHAALRRVETALRDFANAISQAEVALSSAARAAIG